MEQIKYAGEHLLPGQLGHFFTILAFVASMVATVAYFCSVQQKDELKKASWLKMGRWAFIVQAFSVFAVFGILYYIISHHYFEYKYAWQHSSRDLEVQYLLSCFWEGQEGSFLLWSVWHSVLGLILIRTGKKWEGPVMTVLAFAQIGLGTMLLGIYLDLPWFEYKVGSSPFILMRQDAPDSPIFMNPNYLQFKQFVDGNGLNVLLKNYWMVIHPPILFLGFASCIIPFAYAVGGLWTRNYGDWVKPAMPWALFATMVLGTGIMMGAAWAYESLTFGGYWAWDPVENASLVPWLTLVAGVHTMLAYRSSGHALRSTFFFFIISFVLILYSTFLTRSGILGQTSVHSFTDLGMSGQLLIFMGIFTIPAFWMLIARNKDIPKIVKEESTYSREFWLFVGALILMVSAVQITFTTSIPVWNKLLDLFGLKKLFNLEDFAPPTDPVFHYNQIQIWLAAIVGTLTAVVQYMKYKDTPKGTLWKKLAWPTIISAALTVLIGWLGKVNYNEFGPGFLVAIYLMLFASVYAVVANTGYIFAVLKGKTKAAGASVAHIGFGLTLLGILISSSKKEVLSVDKMNMLAGYFTKESGQKSQENTLLPKGLPVQMGPYFVTYRGDSIGTADKEKTFFIVDYEKKESLNAAPTERFTLYPDAYLNVKGQEGQLSPNPDSKHYLTRDIFTYVTLAPMKGAVTDTLPYEKHTIAQGDTIFFSKGFMVLTALKTGPEQKNYKPEPGDIAVGAEIFVHTRENGDFNMRPVYFIRDSTFQGNVPDTIAPLSLAVRFTKILPNDNKVELEIKESRDPMDFIVLKALVFPYINVLWIGIIVMIIGFVMSIRQRMKGAK
ncbi:cytochrome c biogenesis protein CcsA [Chitinophaga sp. GCM10012297]|uniref:Cytochrome c biogenesis protein CcsA n=1 Tax=Chitinophaga chungangae TaxID=2821488 RepID=A0ABS3YGW1_9BACT|nr:cytochrome c biogenesis protein CcsA [Chitinophaga chungangae]MBO9153916.1 cytochrome c biogenesis protein CcsA [Chitinophaga chungangae]